MNILYNIIDHSGPKLHFIVVKGLLIYTKFPKS